LAATACYAAILATAGAPGVIAQTADTAAVVRDNNCAAEVRTQPGSLARPARNGVALLHGQAIRCTRAGNFGLQLRRADGRSLGIAIDSARGWYVALAPPRADQRAVRRAAELRPMVAQPRGDSDRDALRAALATARHAPIRLAIQSELPAEPRVLAHLHRALAAQNAVQLSEDAGAADILLHLARGTAEQEVRAWIFDAAFGTRVPALTLSDHDSATVTEAIDWLRLLARNHLLMRATAEAEALATGELRVDHLQPHQRVLQEVADAWYAGCRTTRPEQAAPAARRLVVQTGDLLGFQVANQFQSSRYYYLLHLAEDGRLNLLTAADGAGARVAPAGTRCLTVVQPAASGGSEHFVALAAATPLSSLRDLLGMTIPAWLFDASAGTTAQPGIAAHVLAISTKE
jgi:hypothetical protein